MTHPLKELLIQRISAGLKRKAVTSCSTWAENYRIMGQPFPGNYSFKHHPWAREMHDCDSEIMVGQKGAQLGFTEVALNKTFYNIDILGNSVLYLLPEAIPGASNFSTSRFDPALELSPHLSSLFSDVKNIGHKRAGSANLFIRGSRSRSQLKSIPVSVAILDEVDEMVQKNIALIFERLSGQMEKQSFLLSTPTIENKGINAYFKQSTQDHWFFKCPCCSRMVELTYPDCLVITGEEWSDPRVLESHIICPECKNILDHAGKSDYIGKGEWVSSHSDRLMRGFHVSQLYSMTTKPSELAIGYLRGRQSPSDAQEFHNSKLGLTYESKDARITETQIQECTKSYAMSEFFRGGKLITMGVDVGTVLHYEITQYDRVRSFGDINHSTDGKVLAAGELDQFEELDDLMKNFTVVSCVIDANPERRKALEFANRFYGRVRLCFYGRGIGSKEITLHDRSHHTMTVDRTSWLDLSLGRIKAGNLSLPVNIPLEYKQHIQNMVRITKNDADGNPVGRYEHTGQDHFAHARNYNELALKISTVLAGSSNITKVL